ncbi:MAG: glycerophosphoryl diester phosphodiesterase membrane domain-containing protein [Patescibacteria group bacterium]|jgi:hypothetical protein|nr:glycerophosphoryl diester phosphodiesterase membrane domain-containing protein [Patescibacteria group bacterium]
MEPNNSVPNSGWQSPVAPTPSVVSLQITNQSTNSDNTHFTSNPFLSFGKGLGAGLLKSPGAIMGLSALILLSLIGIYIGGFIVSAIGFAISPIIGIIAILAAFIGLFIVINLLIGRGAITLIKSINGESVSLKNSAELIPANFSLKLAGYYAIYSLAVGLGLVLFIIPGLFIMARWSLGLFIIVDENAGPVDAIKKSWELTKGNTWNMLGAIITSSIILGQGFLLTMGTMGATANRYQELKALSAAGIKNTTTHWLNYLVSILVPLLIIGYISLYVFIIGFSAYNNLVENAKESQDYSDVQQKILNDSSDSIKEYCFFNGDISNLDAEYLCVKTKEECKANEYCLNIYSYEINR